MRRAKKVFGFELSASYTVEGSFIFPFIIMILFSVISLTFRLHNSVKEQADRLQLSEYARCLTYSLNGIDGDEYDRLLEKYAEGRLNSGYLYSECPVLSVYPGEIPIVRREQIRRFMSVIMRGEELEE